MKKKSSKIISFIMMISAIVGTFFIGKLMQHFDRSSLFAVTDKLNILPMSVSSILLIFGILMVLTGIYCASKNSWKQSSELPTILQSVLSIVFSLIRAVILVGIFYYQNIWFASDKKFICIIELCAILILIIIPTFIRGTRKNSAESPV